MSDTVDISLLMNGQWGGILHGFYTAKTQAAALAATEQSEQIEGEEEVENPSVGYIRFIELDTPTSDGKVTLLMCAAYPTGKQFNATIMHSLVSDGEYQNIGTLRYFGLRGALTKAYSGSIMPYDIDFGIHFEATHGDDDFIPISKAELFGPYPEYLIVVNNEIMRFSGVVPEGTKGYHLTNILRGQFFTNRGDHKVGDEIFVVHTAGSTLMTQSTGLNYFKLIPTATDGTTTIESECTPIPVMIRHKRVHPLMPAKIMANRTGSVVRLAWVPRVKDFGGAGAASADVFTDAWPPVPMGDFACFQDGAFMRYLRYSQTRVVTANAFEFGVAHRLSGSMSQIHVLNVGTADGTYISTARD
jgi:hypothetical protein